VVKGLVGTVKLLAYIVAPLNTLKLDIYPEKYLPSTAAPIHKVEFGVGPEAVAATGVDAIPLT
jgi:hypothetical protein